MILDRVFRPALPSRSPAARVVLAGSAVAWVVLTVWAVRDGWAAAGHSAHHGAPPQGGLVVEPWRAGWLLTWLLMVAAMMWPLAAPALVVVSRSAFRPWRVGLVATCLGTVTVLWVAAGLAVASVAYLLAVPAGSRMWQLAWVAVAVLAGRSAWRARLLWRCAKIPAVAPCGVRGLVSASIAGAVTWRRCALLCGPVMAAMVVSHDLVLMLGASLAAGWEAAHPRAWRDPVPAMLLAAVAAWVLLQLVVGSG
jgi:hypothetical protein